MNAPATAASVRRVHVDAAARLRLASTRLARRLRQLADTGLTPSQLSALATLDRGGAMTLGALADAERVAAPTVTRIVARLEADGLVSRSPDPADRRASRIDLTASGRDLLAATRRERTAWLAERLASLGADDFERLVAGLEVMERIGEDERAPATGRSTT